MNKIRIAFLLSAALYLGACASTPEKLQGAEYYFNEGQKAFDKKRCLEASEHFQRLVSNFPGSQRVTDAQYYLAESFFCGQDYVNAAFEYQRLLDIYPASDWADDAQFKIGESHFKQIRRSELDQKETFDALNAFRYFIEDNPDSPLVTTALERIGECRDRLAKKYYEGAYLYQSQGYFEAARITFQDVVRDYSDTIWYYHTIFRLGQISQAEGDTDQAVQYWKEVLEQSGDEKLVKEVQKAIAELSKSSG